MVGGPAYHPVSPIFSVYEETLERLILSKFGSRLILNLTFRNGPAFLSIQGLLIRQHSPKIFGECFYHYNNNNNNNVITSICYTNFLIELKNMCTKFHPDILIACADRRTDIRPEFNSSLLKVYLFWNVLDSCKKVERYKIYLDRDNVICIKNFKITRYLVLMVWDK